jgi:hypothetical protein
LTLFNLCRFDGKNVSTGNRQFFILRDIEDSQVKAWMMLIEDPEFPQSIETFQNIQLLRSH